jgi:hypothetical protein
MAMKDRPHASVEAIARIRAMGEKAIGAFLDEVPLDSYRQLVDYLPNVPGFRKNTPSGIKQQKQHLAKRLTRKNPDDGDHEALYVVWRAWASGRLGDANRIEELLDGLESTAGQGSKPLNGKAATSKEPAVALFAELRQMSAKNVCSRETIHRLFEFSPFSADPAITDHIEQSKSAADIERDATFTELPRRLRKDEEELKELRTKVDALSAQIKTTKPGPEIASAKLAQLEKDLVSQNEAVARLRGSLEQAVSDIKANFEETSAIVRDLESLRRLVQGLNAPSPAQSPSPSASDAAVAEVKTEIDKLANALAALSKDVAALPVPQVFPEEEFANKIKQLSEQVTELDQIRVSATELAGLAFRIDAIERNAKEGSAPELETKPVRATEDKGSLRLNGPQAFRISSDESLTPQKLTDLAKTLETLTEALQRAGLKKSAAQIFAEEIVAALSCNQVVFFKGSLASTLAVTCAKAVSARQAWSISVPVGLTDSGLLREGVNQRLDAASQDVTTIIFEGINRTTLDVTRDALASSQRTMCFGTILDGLASLPLELAYFEYGPVFDLDCLEWRSRVELDAVPVHGSLSVEGSYSIRRTLQGAAVNADEPLRLLRKFMPKRNIRIERTIVASHAALSHVKQGKSTVTAIQSLAYGWLAPLWTAVGLSSEEAESELDGGKLDGSTPDTRIAELLKSGGFSDAAKGGSA